MTTDETPFRDRDPILTSDALHALNGGELEIVGRMMWSSNSTYLVNIGGAVDGLQAIYKPQKGERPLWDFPSGLHLREVASYKLAKCIGWDIVPPTVLRDGPFGIGSLQLFIPCDFDVHYFHVLEEATHHLALQKICLFDYVANSTDRKGGHCLLDNHGNIWAIDNGLTFHVEFKLRTVIWDWAGVEIPKQLLDDLREFASNPLSSDFDDLLSKAEQSAVLERAQKLLSSGVFPSDHSGTRYPWPII